MENQVSRILGKTLNLTKHDLGEEEYILTKEEEDAAIQHAIGLKKDHAIWKMREVLAMSEEQIKQKVSETNWLERIDVEQVKKTANSNKSQDLWFKQRREEEKKIAEKAKAELHERYNADYMFRLMKWTSKNEFGKEFVVNNSNKYLITAVCYFLSRDERFQTELGFDLNKGLLIRGTVGLGKTYIPTCVARNELNPVKIVSLFEINDELKKSGEWNIPQEGYKILYLDDVGAEEVVVNHYGTKISFFPQFIQTYYLRNKKFNKLIVSTNNNFAQLEERYGFRVRSRMREMFNVVDVSGEDMRK